MRYERKYRIEDSNYDRVLHEIMSNPAGFDVAYPDRCVNSVYYDDINYSAYNDNLLGISDRVKYRVRWYGDSLELITKPILEKKIKKNLLGIKELVAIDDFDLSDGAPELSLVHGGPLGQLFPHVVIRYQRTYLESADGLLRATIDSKLQYINLINGGITNQIQNDNAIILEIKYNNGYDKIADDALQFIPYRVTKNSKYVTGMKYYLD